MLCPVCGASAKDITVKTFDGSTVRCTTCGDYDIAGTVKDTGMLEKVAPEERQSALQKAKRTAAHLGRPGGRGVGSDKRPMIMAYML